MTEIYIPLFTIFNLICWYNFHLATLVSKPNVSHAAKTRPNMHHPCSTCRGIRQEPLDGSPDILQNFYERLSQSPNIMPLPFLLFSALNISQSGSPPFVFLFCFGFIWLTPSALRKMPPQYPTSQHPLSPDGIYFFFSLANAHPLPFTCRLFLPYFYTPFRFFYALHCTFFFFFFTLLRFPLQRLWFERFLRFPISPSRIWSFLLFNTHTSCPLYNNPRQAPCGLRRQIYRQIFQRLREGQVPPQQDSCLRASEGVAWISYSWHGPAALIYENLSRRGN